jgi:hypothetical protein
MKRAPPRFACRLDQPVAVRDALGNALGRYEVAHVEGADQLAQRLGTKMGVDGHDPPKSLKRFQAGWFHPAPCENAATKQSAFSSRVVPPCALRKRGQHMHEAADPAFGSAARQSASWRGSLKIIFSPSSPRFPR